MSSMPVGREVVIWHNPRCGKSRETLALIREAGIEPRIVEYLTTLPSREELLDAAHRLRLPLVGLLRSKEKPFKDLGLGSDGTSDEALLAAVEAHPMLIERPIVLVGHEARIGRPPEMVREILPK